MRNCLSIPLAMTMLLLAASALRSQPVTPPSTPTWTSTIHPATTSYEVLEHKVLRRTNGRLVDPNLFPSAEFAPDGTQIMPRSWVARTPNRFDYITFRQDRHTPPADLGDPKSMSSRLYWTESGDLLNLGGPDMVRGLQGAVMRWDRRNLRDFHTEASQREAGIVGLGSALEGVIDRHPELFLPESVRRAQDAATTPLSAEPPVSRTTWTDSGHRFEIDSVSDADGPPRTLAVRIRPLGHHGVRLDVRALQHAQTDSGRWAWTEAAGEAVFTGPEGVVEYRNYMARRSVPVDVRQAMDPRLFRFDVPENYRIVDEALPIVRHRLQGDNFVADRDTIAPGLIERAVASGDLTEEHPLRGPYCGVQALYGAARMLGVEVDYHLLIDPRFVGAQGSSAAQLVAAAEAHGLAARVLQGVPRSDVTRLTPPSLLHVRKHPSAPTPDHWVLLMGVEGGKVRIFDPIMAPSLRSVSELAAIWNGVAISVSSATQNATSNAVDPGPNGSDRSPTVMVIAAAAAAVLLSGLSVGLLCKTASPARATLVAQVIAVGACTAVAAVGLDLLRVDSVLRSPELLRSMDLSSRLNSVTVLSPEQLRQIRADGQALEFDVGQLKQMPDPAVVTLVADRTGRKPVVLLVNSPTDSAAASGVARKLIQAGHQRVMVSPAAGMSP